MKNLIKIQSELKAPKNQRNNFGNYNYRNCEDILEAVKPLLDKYECTLTISDDIIEVGGRVYVKAIATFYDIKLGTSLSVSAFAREPEQQKGMSESQVTGASSSYSRKYALNGLFLIDDTKDADATNTHDKEIRATYVQGSNSTVGTSIAQMANLQNGVSAIADIVVAQVKKKPVLLLNTENFGNCRKAYLKDKSNLAKICEKYEVSNEVHFALTQE